MFATLVEAAAVERTARRAYRNSMYISEGLSAIGMPSVLPCLCPPGCTPSLFLTRPPLC